MVGVEAAEAMQVTEQVEDWWVAAEVTGQKIVSHVEVLAVLVMKMVVMVAVAVAVVQVVVPMEETEEVGDGVLQGMGYLRLRVLFVLSEQLAMLLEVVMEVEEMREVLMEQVLERIMLLVQGVEELVVVVVLGVVARLVHQEGMEVGP
jgi:hypothetical protein